MLDIKTNWRQLINNRKKRGLHGYQLLISVIHYYFRQFLRFTIHRNKNLIHGRALYSLPVLVSYPRSGTNWLRFIIESLTDKRTPGQIRYSRSKEYAVDRAHCASKNGMKYDKMILVLRDYRECMLRHLDALWLHHQNVEDFLNEQNVISKPSWYVDNIKAFEDFPRQKLLLYYEDLVDNPSEYVKELGQFLGVEELKILHFLKELPKKQQESEASYNKTHGAHTAGKKSKHSFHSKKLLSSEQAKNFDRYFATNYPEIWEKYLKRYTFTVTTKK
ncbi:MAG: sulfotransferase domain-containing protein [Cyclobacteriaceae bacterium]